MVDIYIEGNKNFGQEQDQIFDDLRSIAVREPRRGLHIEKLNKYVWSFRSNKKRRGLFTFIKQEGKQSIVFLDYLPNHEYPKSKFLKNEKLLPRFLDVNFKDQPSFNQEDGVFDFENEKNPIQENNDTKDDIRIIPFYYSQNKFLILDAVQCESIKSTTPLMIEGPPGSGKTSIGMILFDQAYEKTKGKILYVTQSTTLANSIRKEWLKTHDQDVSSVEDSYPDTHIRSYDELICELTPCPKEAILDFEMTTKQIKIWHDKYKKKIRSQFPSFDELREEFRIISGFESLESYQSIGEKQSRVQTDKLSKDDKLKLRKLLWDAYENFMIEVASKDLIIPEFFRLNTENKYDFIFVDESQLLSHLQIRNLLMLADQYNIVFSSDTRQSVMDTTPKNTYTFNLLREVCPNSANRITLKKSYRCPESIIAFSKVFDDLRVKLTGNLKSQANIIPDLSKDGALYWIDPSKDKFRFDQLTKLEDSTQICVLTHSEFSAEVERLFPNVTQRLSLENSTGLEYDYVILYRPLDHEQFITINKEMNHASDKLHNISTNKVLSQCFVASSRCQKQMFVVQEKRPRLKNIVAQLTKATLYSSENVELKDVLESTPNMWLERAQQLALSGQEAIACQILSEKLKYPPQELEKTIQGWTSASSSQERTSQNKTKTTTPSDALSSDSPHNNAHSSHERSDLSNVTESASENSKNNKTDYLQEDDGSRFQTKREGKKRKKTSSENKTIPKKQAKTQPQSKVSDKTQKGNALSRDVTNFRRDLSKALDIISLHEAARLCSGVIVQALIDRGADVNALDYLGDYAIQTSIRKLNLSAFKVLLECGRSYYVNKCSFDLVRFILQAFNHAEREDPNSKSILYNMLELALKKLPDINLKQDINGDTVLYYAISGRNFSAVKMIVDMGGSLNMGLHFTYLINLTLDDCKTPSKLIQVLGEETVNELLIPRDRISDYPYYLHHFVKMRNKEYVEYILNKGGDVNFIDQYDKTPISYAIENRDSAMVELLADRGATNPRPGFFKIVRIENTGMHFIFSCEKNCLGRIVSFFSIVNTKDLSDRLLTFYSSGHSDEWHDLKTLLLDHRICFNIQVRDRNGHHLMYYLNEEAKKQRKNLGNQSHEIVMSYINSLKCKVEATTLFLFKGTQYYTNVFVKNIDDHSVRKSYIELLHDENNIFWVMKHLFENAKTDEFWRLHTTLIEMVEEKEPSAMFQKDLLVESSDLEGNTFETFAQKLPRPTENRPILPQFATHAATASETQAAELQKLRAEP